MLLKNTFWILLFLAISSIGINSVKASLLKQIDQELQNIDFPPSSEIRGILKDKDIILVPGMMNEFLKSSYFQVIKDELKNALMVHDALIYYPKTSHDVLISADELAKELIKKYKGKKNRKIILIGHSKGGVEILLMLLENPQMVSMIDRAVLIQSPVKGSPIADMSLSFCKPLLSPCHLLYWWASAAGESLRFKNIVPLFLEKLSLLTNEEYKEISSKVFYVRSKNKEEFFSYEFVITKNILDRYGDNDGMVLTSDQFFDHFGNDLGVLLADHGDFVTRLPSQIPAGDLIWLKQRAFIRALFKSLY